MKIVNGIYPLTIHLRPHFEGWGQGRNEMLLDAGEWGIAMF